MIKRGTVFLYTGNVKRYKAVKEQIERHRREGGRKSLFLHRSKFINYVSQFSISEAGLLAML